STPALYTLFLHDALPICPGWPETPLWYPPMSQTRTSSWARIDTGEFCCKSSLPRVPEIDSQPDSQPPKILFPDTVRQAHQVDFLDRKSTRLNSSHVKHSQ